MKFHDYLTQYQMTRRLKRLPGHTMFMSERAYYDMVLSSLETPAGRMLVEGEGPHQHISMKIICQFDRAWYAAGRPYYKTWPGIVDAIMRVKLDRRLSEFQLPRTVILLRLAEGKELVTPDNKLIQTVGVLSTAEGLAFSGVMLHPEGGVNSTVGHMSLEEDPVIEDFIVADEARLGTRLDFGRRIIKLVIGTLVLARDPEFIKPDVLAADRLEYNRTGDRRLVDKAIKKGVRGFNLGEAFEHVPHLRKPHLALRWCGPGGKLAKIVPVKGSIVHRAKAAAVPTGRYDPDGREVEKTGPASNA